MKILAVDLGDARTGLACCDKTEFLASPLCVLHERDINNVLSRVIAAAEEVEAGEIVIGHPKHMNGDEGDRAEKCAFFAKVLAQHVNIPVTLWDERCTTVMAHDILNETDVRGKKRKETVDAVAATLILESYLQYRKNKREQQDKA